MPQPDHPEMTFLSGKPDGWIEVNDVWPGQPNYIPAGFCQIPVQAFETTDGWCLCLNEGAAQAMRYDHGISTYAHPDDVARCIAAAAAQKRTSALEGRELAATLDLMADHISTAFMGGIPHGPVVEAIRETLREEGIVLVNEWETYAPAAAATATLEQP